ncbi:MAG: penicillin-binding protein 1C [Halanaerobiales bacterium]
MKKIKGIEKHTEDIKYGGKLFTDLLPQRKTLLNITVRLLLYTLILFLIVVMGAFIFIRLPSPLFLQDYSTVVVDNQGSYLRVFLNENEQWCFPPDQEEIPEKLKTAVINYEDKRFYQHNGIDYWSLGRAVIQNLKAGQVTSGASTITMQIARLSRPKDRNFRNKIIEMVQAFKLDIYYTKEELLQMYFNHAPYGGNIIGYKAASLRYFAKFPEELTWGEAATLAVLPNSPGLINPMQSSERLREKRNGLLNKLYNRGIIDQQTLVLAVAEEIPDRQYPFDLMAPLLARELYNKYDEKIIRTTISRKHQQEVRSITDRYMQQMMERGIYNCAVLLADTESGAVRAYLGSNDFFDIAHSGRINGVQMTRSTGSTLKPFLYGLAMDEGLIVPESKLKDIPVAYGSYMPHNADGSFSGVVTSRVALTQSLNAPAVDLLEQYGVEKFYGFLQKAGVSGLFRTTDEYGLPLILGGAEASLWDLASMYYSLGNYGDFRKLHVVEREIYNSEVENISYETNIYNSDEDTTAESGYGETQGRQLISRGSSYLVLDMLSDLKRPGMEYYWKEYSSNRKIAWKTGTSYGNRDAWAVGVSPRWTIAVWVGNFSGEENKNLTGLDAAAPLLFRIFNSLNGETYNNWFEAPDDLKEIMVSANTGYRLRQNIGNEVKVLAPNSARPLRFSPYEKLIFVNDAETEEVCSMCWEADDVKEKYWLVYPPDVIEYMKNRGSRYLAIPPHRRDCPAAGSYNPIDFIYPRDESVIQIPRGLDGQYQKIKFKIAHSYQDTKLYWYLNENYLGETNGLHEKLISPEEGWQRLYVIDADGNDSEIRFYVQREDGINEE